MEDATKFPTVNIKEERINDESAENTEENIIYLPISRDTVKLERDIETEDPLKIKTECRTEERQESNDTLTVNCSNNLFHVNTKTKSYEVCTDTEDNPNYSTMNFELTEPKIEISGQRLAKKRKQTESKFEQATDGDIRTQKKSELKKKRDNKVDQMKIKFICNVCDERFTQKKLFNSHIVKHTTKETSVGFEHLSRISSNNHECDVCQKKFTKYAYLKKHMMIHSEVRPHECEICHKRFARNDGLTRHMLIHSGVKRHVCNVCQKNFRHADVLKKHFLSHSGIKPHECNICHKKFTRTGGLNKHMLLHSGLKPHECNICRKNFTQSEHLKVHMLTHSVGKHECKICHKKFKRPPSLKMHMLIHSGIKQYEFDVHA